MMQRLKDRLTACTGTELFAGVVPQAGSPIMQAMLHLHASVRAGRRKVAFSPAAGVVPDPENSRHFSPKVALIGLLSLQLAGCTTVTVPNQATIRTFNPIHLEHCEKVLESGEKLDCTLLSTERTGIHWQSIVGIVLGAVGALAL